MNRYGIRAAGQAVRGRLPAGMAALGYEQQLAGRGAPLHLGMGLRGLRKPVDAADIDLQLPTGDPVEQACRTLAQQRRRGDMVEEDCVADLDAARQAHDVERAGPAEHSG